MYRIADLIESRLDAFAAAESFDQGKTVSIATRVDIPRVVHNFRFFAGAVLHHEDSCTHLSDSVVSYSISQPVGVAGLISPWNLPLYLLSWKIAPAIACGNTVVAKPSEFTSLTAMMLCQVFLDAELPPGVVNVVFGTGPRAGAALVQHPDVPLISFTGGTATAKHIMRDSIDHFKKLSLELGGKNPNVIFDDANLDECLAKTQLSSFANQGEICLCGSRIFVQRALYDEFVRRFVEQTRRLIVGDPTNPASFMGALASAQHRDKVAYYVQLAREEGGEIAFGGGVPQVPAELAGGYWFEPTIITGLTPSCRVMQEEIFGPVVTITPFDTEQEVIAHANGVKYGLSATVWTQSLQRAHRVARALQAGTVWLNCWLVRDLRMPFGGMKQSGIGREGGKYSIEFFTEQKAIVVQL
jgi:acyl-CoA reductase-like NAD-dependent aldehyde dehydrogenase